MIAIITLVIVAVQFAIVALILMGGKSSRVRNEQVISENNAARTYIKRELAAIKELVTVPSGGIVSPDGFREMVEDANVQSIRVGQDIGQGADMSVNVNMPDNTEDEWQELINEGRDDLPL